MAPKMDADIARRYLRAAQDGAVDDRDQLLRELLPSLEQAIRAVCRRKASLLRAARTQEDDLVQDLYLKLLRSPPCQSADAANPEAVLRGWVRSVAVRHLISLQRRRKRDAPLDEEPERREEHAVGKPPPSGDQVVEWTAVLAALKRCAEALEGRKAAVWKALSSDPTATGLDLAGAMQLVDVKELARFQDALDRAEGDRTKLDEAVRKRLKKVEGNAYQHRRLTIRALGECLRDCGFDDLPEVLR